MQTALLLLLLAVAGINAQADPCRTCEIILNIAEHHFNNHVNDERQLLAQLRRECNDMGQYEGPAVAQECLDIVNNNIDKIFSDLSSGKGTSSTCYDIHACASATTHTLFSPYTGTWTYATAPPERREKIEKFRQLLRLRAERYLS